MWTVMSILTSVNLKTTENFQKEYRWFKSGGKDWHLTKREILRFCAWKKRKEETEPAWESPWGLGRPGWHLECSVMAKHLLGNTIYSCRRKIYNFPHHENEIAQSECCNDKIFANYWMHNGMITVDNEKMSKSKGNFLYY